MGFDFDQVQMLRHQLLQLLPVGSDLPEYNKSKLQFMTRRLNNNDFVTEQLHKSTSFLKQIQRKMNHNKLSIKDILSANYSSRTIQG